MTVEQSTIFYADVCVNMHTMYTRCKLVHGDLSEYNMLYHNGQVVFIDVSQSVEHEHPYATEFLRKDCRNVRAHSGILVFDLCVRCEG
jgi:RIO kinase 1